MSGKNWVVLVAGSKDWENYQHQVCPFILLYSLFSRHISQGVLYHSLYMMTATCEHVNYLFFYLYFRPMCAAYIRSLRKVRFLMSRLW